LLEDEPGPQGKRIGTIPEAKKSPVRGKRKAPKGANSPGLSSRGEVAHPLCLFREGKRVFPEAPAGKRGYYYPEHHAAERHSSMEIPSRERLI